MHKQAIYGLSVAILLFILVPVIGITAYSPQDYTQTDSNVNSNKTEFLRPSEIVELYPMSEDEINFPRPYGRGISLIQTTFAR